MKIFIAGHKAMAGSAIFNKIINQNKSYMEKKCLFNRYLI